MHRIIETIRGHQKLRGKEILLVHFEEKNIVNIYAHLISPNVDMEQGEQSFCVFKNEMPPKTEYGTVWNIYTAFALYHTHLSKVAESK